MQLGSEQCARTHYTPPDKPQYSVLPKMQTTIQQPNGTGKTYKKKDLKCPKCPKTFTFESQVKAHMNSHCSKPSFFCVYQNVDVVSSMRVISLDILKDTTENCTSALTVPTVIVTNGITIPTDSVIVELLSTNARRVAKNSCLIPKKGDT